MKLLRVKKYRSGNFTIGVLAKHNLIDWQECLYLFKYTDGSVYFLYGGQESGKRLIDNAESKGDAIKKATDYLETWLRECGAID